MKKISIHAPLAGCDLPADFAGPDVSNFNPRTPCGVRHVLVDATGSIMDFNPRTPCGVRLDEKGFAITYTEFQSTHPLRGATS